MASNTPNSSAGQRKQVGLSPFDDDRLGGANENTLCDIIAQQRKFQLQLRQESDAATRFDSASAAPASSRPSGRFAPLNKRQMTMMPTSGEHLEQLPSAGKQGSGKQPARRKFSLSAAMSNLATFATSSQQQQQQSMAAAGAPARPPRRARDSLTEQQVKESAARLAGSHQLASSAGEFRSASATGSAPPSADYPSASGPSHGANSAEKKRGLVHKAIRRGSKMFDSMLLRQSQAAGGEQPSGSDCKSSTPASRQNSCDGQTSSVASVVGSSATRVQFASSIEKLDKVKKNCPSSQVDEAAAAEQQAEIERAIRQLKELNKQDQEDDDQTFRRRRRKLRLGSIPHDLRRALSLGGAHAHHKNSADLRAGGSRRVPTARVGDEQHPEEQSAEEQAADKLAALRLRHEAANMPSKPANNSTSSASSSSGSIGRPASSKLTGSQLAAASGGRLKRKNSLFAPLTNVAFHYHSSSRHKEPPAGKQQAAVSPSKASAAAAATPSNSQSASFSLCQDHSRTYKLIIFGSSAVGKTSLIQRFLYGHFPATHKPTVEELHSNKYNIPELGEIYLEILDTSGTFEFPAMRRLSIEKGDAFILVFSAADEASWLEVQHLRGLILEEKTGGSARKLAAAGPSSVGNGRLPSFESPSSERQEQQQPISSVYAAATRLTAASRRTSSSPALGKGQLASGAAAGQRPANSPLIEPAGEPPSIKSQYSNSQFSKVLSQRARDRADEEEEDDDDDDDDDDDHYNDHQEEPLAAAVSNQAGGPEQREQLRQQKAPMGGPPVVVVANKCDLDTASHQVDLDMAERLVRDQWGNSFVCCSAKEALNIDRVFKELLRQAHAPEVLSQFVIDDHQQRRQSLPVLKNQLSAHHVKGLRNLYNQQQQAAQVVPPTARAGSQAATAGGSAATGQQPHDVQLAAGAQDLGQCAIM